jgi:hypothetical protein
VALSRSLLVAIGGWLVVWWIEKQKSDFLGSSFDREIGLLMVGFMIYLLTAIDFVHNLDEAGDSVHGFCHD